MNAAQKQILKKENTTGKWAFLIIVFVIGISVGLLLADTKSIDSLTFDEASTLVNIENTDTPNDVQIDFAQFWEVWSQIQTRHVDKPVSESDLFYGAIQGLVAGAGDPYSAYLPPEESQEFNEEIQGSFEGIGAEIGIKQERLTIIAPLVGSPAQQAGVVAGDKILYIDGLDASFMSVHTAVQYIRGEKGTTVVLTVEREGESAPLDIPITRDTIEIESVKWEMKESSGQNIAVITITNFNGDTIQRFNEAVQSIVLQQPQGIILDLRNNPGGFLQAAVGIGSAFIENGKPVLHEQDSEGDLLEFNAIGGEQLRGLPVVVLQNQGSASASEILAGALQDYDIAEVIGEQSFGKGTVQELIPFEDGSSLKLTIAEWLTPNKNTINDIGITPDYYVERTVEDFSEDRDPQMDAALLFFTNAEEFAATYNPPTSEQTQ